MPCPVTSYALTMILIVFSDVFDYASMLSVVIPIAIATYSFIRLERYLRLLYILLWLSFVIDILLELLIMAGWLSSNIPFFHFYTVAEFTLYSLLYKEVLRDVKPLMAMLIVAFLLFKLSDLWLITRPDQPDTAAMTLESIIIIFYCFLYFDQLLKEKLIMYLTRHPMFWINSGVLVYFSGSFFLFLFSPYIFKNEGSVDIYWSFHAVLSLLKNLSFAIAFYLVSKSYRLSLNSPER